ncbi:YceD family protein [Bradyrhizobium sp. STM 3562]|uniref:YceD family protein n=1 Tax=Bradyrhizobium sp. STM 3562 TaxID=578924 RepID=UPI00388D4364
MNNAIDPADPWRATVNVVQIPDTGLHREIEANPAVRATIAEIAGVREISSARASFDLSLRSRGRVHVAGRLTARIGQTCVVTLEPIENDIDEAIDLIFAPEEQITPVADDLGENPRGAEGELPEPPEPIVNGIIDLGRLATDVLFLAIDPYPRKPGAVFEPHITAADPEDHPFAALKTLKAGAKKPKSGGSKDG